MTTGEWYVIYTFQPHLSVQLYRLIWITSKTTLEISPFHILSLCMWSPAIYSHLTWRDMTAHDIYITNSPTFNGSIPFIFGIKHLHMLLLRPTPLYFTLHYLKHWKIVKIYLQNSRAGLFCKWRRKNCAWKYHISTVSVKWKK